MKTEEKLRVYKELLEQTLEVNGRILKDCYWRPTVSQETLTQIENLTAAIEEHIKDGSV